MIPNLPLPCSKNQSRFDTFLFDFFSQGDFPAVARYYQDPSPLLLGVIAFFIGRLDDSVKKELKAVQSLERNREMPNVSEAFFSRKNGADLRS